ncbi:protein GRINL1A [Loxodonta africana]|nr:protein GRINL1A [Loxodonta africana]
MSSLARGFEPLAPEDWGRRSLAELREMLKRQERLLRNEKFICKLPDKGKKILDSVAKLKVAVAEREEFRGQSQLFHPVRLDCTVRQTVTAGVDVDTAKAQNSDQILHTSPPVPGSSSVDNSRSSKTASPKQGLVHLFHKGSEETAEAEGIVNGRTAPSSGASAASLSEASKCLPQHLVSRQAEDSSSSSDNLIVDRLQRITIADPGEHRSRENTSTDNLTGPRSGAQKKPHYMEVLEVRAQNPVPPPHKFKTNVLPSQLPHGSSSQWRGRQSPVSSAERRRRDKEHLDDITAARLLPLHHMPAQLLSMEESLALQKEQKQNYEEMQAKLAAHKLAERLNIKMQSYTPEGETLRRYREVRDEDDQSSDDGL